MAPEEQKTIVNSVLEKHNRDKSLLVDILQDVQASIGDLRKKPWKRLPRLKSRQPRLCVATFFNACSLSRSRNLISVCMGTACSPAARTRYWRAPEGTRLLRPAHYERPQIHPGTVNCVATRSRPGGYVGVDYHGEMTPGASFPF
jgi:NADH:ubiquinone oxidoreductase subunit E